MEESRRLIERDKELATLQRIFDATVQGQGQVVLISGGVGTGKTALMQTFLNIASKSGAITLSATASRAESSHPLGVINQIFRGRALAPKVKNDIFRLIEDAGCNARFPSIRGNSLNYDHKDWRAFDELCGLLLNISQECPIAISLDDMRYADDVSLRFLQYLALRANTSRVFLMFGEYIWVVPPHPLFYTEILSYPHSYHIRLAGLSQSGLVTLLARHLDLPTGQVAHLGYPFHTATGGNVLIARALIDDNLNNALEFIPAELTFGIAFSRAVLTYFYRSEPIMLELARATATLGEQASPALIGEMLGRDAEFVRWAIKELSESGLLHASGQFRNDAMRSAVLGGMNQGERAAMHGRAAAVLHKHAAPAEVLSQHLLAGERIEPSWAVPVLLEGAELALANRDMALASAYLHKAYKESPDEEQRLVIKSAIMQAEWRIDPATAARHLPELATAARAGIMANLHPAIVANCLLWMERISDASQLLDLLNSQPSTTLTPARVGVDQLLGLLYPNLFKSVDPSKIFQQIEKINPTTDAVHLNAAAALAAALTNRTAEAANYAERVLLTSALDDVTIMPIIFALRALIYSDRLEAAESWCCSFLEEARDIPIWQSLILGIQALLKLIQGDLVNAHDYSITAMAKIRTGNSGVITGDLIATALLAATAMGKYDESAAYLRIPVPEILFHSIFGIHYMHARGRYYLTTGRSNEALIDFYSCHKLMAEWNICPSHLIPWRIDTAHAHLAIGQDLRARQLAAEQLADLEPGHARLRGMSLRAMALASGPDKRAPLLETAAKTLQRSNARLELAYTLIDLSDSYQTLGEYRKSRTAAQKAQELAAQCGAELLRGKSAPGGDRRSQASAVSGPLATLSEAELRVAALAARGCTNQQIAGKLYITVSTVEQHLTRVYRKLKVNGRFELPEELRLGTR